VTLGSSASSVTFSSIPATYRDLILVVDGTLTSGEGELTAIVNGDTGANYSRVWMGAASGGAFSGKASGESQLRFGYFAAVKHTSITHFIDYSATDKHKTTLSRPNNPTVDIFGWASRWANTAAITSLVIDTTSAGSFAAGTTLNLYGVIA
jgi:hypothetical protein